MRCIFEWAEAHQRHHLPKFCEVIDAALCSLRVGGKRIGELDLEDSVARRGLEESMRHHFALM